MNTTARTMTRRIATDSAAIAALVINGIFDDFETCELCELPTDYLYERTTTVTVGDWDEVTEIRVCEHCADTRDLGYVAD